MTLGTLKPPEQEKQFERIAGAHGIERAKTAKFQEKKLVGETKVFLEKAVTKKLTARIRYYAFIFGKSDRA